MKASKVKLRCCEKGLGSEVSQPGGKKRERRRASRVELFGCSKNRNWPKAKSSTNTPNKIRRKA